MSKVYELAVVTKVVVQADSEHAAFETLLDIENEMCGAIVSKGHFFARGKGTVIKEVLKNDEGHYCIDESYGEVL